MHYEVSKLDAILSKLEPTGYPTYLAASLSWTMANRIVTESVRLQRIHAPDDPATERRAGEVQRIEGIIDDAKALLSGYVRMCNPDYAPDGESVVQGVLDRDPPQVQTAVMDKEAEAEAMGLSVADLEAWDALADEQDSADQAALEHEHQLMQTVVSQQRRSLVAEVDQAIRAYETVEVVRLPIAGIILAKMCQKLANRLVGLRAQIRREKLNMHRKMQMMSEWRCINEAYELAAREANRVVEAQQTGEALEEKVAEDPSIIY